MEKLPRISLENQMERAVLEVINDVMIMESQGRYCSCDHFRNDVAAIVLNQIPARYATSFRGSLYTLESIQADEELKSLIYREVLHALNIVAAAPRCEEPECPLKQYAQKDSIDLELAPSQAEPEPGSAPASR